MLYTSLSGFQNLPAGTGAAYTASFNSGAASGAYQSNHTLVVSDANLPGAQPGTSLVLVLKGTITAHSAADLDGDGDVDMNDVSVLVNVLLGLDTNPAYVAASDLDPSGTLDGADIQRFVNLFLPP